MIEIKIWTHIGHPQVRVDRDTLAQMEVDMEAGITGRYRVMWRTEGEKMLTINWSNVIMLECPTRKSIISSESY